MDFLSAQARQVLSQLRGMSVSQRIAVVLLLIVLAGGMWGLIRWGQQGDWVALLDQSFTPEQIQRVQVELVSVGDVPSKVVGDRLMIKGTEDHRRQVMAVLAQRGALPRDMSLGYTALVKESSVFMGDRSRVWMEHRGLENELSGVIRNFQGVRDAHVFIEVPTQRTFGARSAGSRASVHVTLPEGQALDKQRVTAIANFVTGAVSGLSPRDVKITDGVRYYRAADGNEEMPTELLDVQRQAEEHHTQKIYDQLRYIPGVLVNVHAALQVADEQVQEKKLGPAVVDSETSKLDESSGMKEVSAPGVRPNQGRTLTEASSGMSNTREENDTSYKGERDASVKTTVRRPGYVERLTASVNVPRSYLERIMVAQGSGAAKSDPKAIESIAASELPKIRDQVRPLVNATKDDQVTVNWYYDVPGEARESPVETRPSGVLALAKSYGPQAGLGLLAVISLVFVMRLARRAPAPVPEMAHARAGGGSAFGWGHDAAESGGSLRSLGGGPRTVGEAEEIEGVMVGHEIDEEVVRTQHVAKQISQLIKEDPAAAAGIVHHWLQGAK